MKTTYYELHKLDKPWYDDGWEPGRVNPNCEKHKEVTVLEILHNCGEQYAFRALKTQKPIHYYLLLADILEKWLDIYETINPTCNNRRYTIDILRKYVAGEVSTKFFNKVILAKQRNGFISSASSTIYQIENEVVEVKTVKPRGFRVDFHDNSELLRREVWKTAGKMLKKHLKLLKTSKNTSKIKNK